MKDFMDKLVDSLSNGNYLLGIVIVVVAFIFNYKTIVDFWEERKKARISKLTDAVKCDFVSGLTESHLQEELATEHFKITTGIRLEKQFREAVIKAHQSTNGTVSFVHFKRAIPHFSYDGDSGNVTVCISKLELFIYWFNFIFGVGMALFGLLLTGISSQIPNISLIQVFSVIFIGVFFIFTSIFMLSQTLPVVSAKIIEKELSSIAKKENKKSAAS